MKPLLIRKLNHVFHKHVPPVEEPADCSRGSSSLAVIRNLSHEQGARTITDTRRSNRRLQIGRRNLYFIRRSPGSRRGGGGGERATEIFQFPVHLREAFFFSRLRAISLFRCKFVTGHEEMRSFVSSLSVFPFHLAFSFATLEMREAISYRKPVSLANRS